MQETLNLLDGSLILTDHQLKITDRNLLQQNIHRLAELSALGKNPQKGAAQYLIRKAALEFGAILSSINDFYLAAWPRRNPVYFYRSRNEFAYAYI